MPSSSSAQPGGQDAQVGAGQEQNVSEVRAGQVADTDEAARSTDDATLGETSRTDPAERTDEFDRGDRSDGGSDEERPTAGSERASDRADDDADDGLSLEDEEERRRREEEFAREHDPADHDVAAGEEFRQRGDLVADGGRAKAVDSEGGYVDAGDAAGLADGSATPAAGDRDS